MSSDAKRLLDDIARTQADLRSLEDRLAGLQRSCKHRFSDPAYDPIVTEGYRDPGDTPGTMGIDWRGPTYIPRSEKKRWKRTCPDCKLTQTTEYTEKRERSGRIPGTTAIEEVPIFPDR